MKKILLAGVICMLGLAGPAMAKDTGTSAGLITKQTTCVRAEGMGSAQAAVPTDESGAIGWNPAALQNLKAPEVSAVYYRGIADDAFGAFNYDMNLNKDLTCGAGLLFYDAGTFELNDDAGESTSVSAQRDYLAVLTGAYRLGVVNGLTAGANLKFLHSTLLGKYTAMAMAVDLGAQYKFSGLLKNLQVGLALKNFGTPVKYLESADSLPSYALFGAAYNAFKNKTFTVLLAGDGQYDLEKKWQGNAGAEVRITELIAVRGGYKLASDLGSFTVGLGLNFNNFQLDYAFSPSLVLNSTHIASLKYTLGPLGKPAKEKVAPEVAEKPYMPENVTAKPVVPSEKLRAEVIEIRKAGGRASEVIMSAGSEQKVKVGFEGVIADAAGNPMAGIVIRQVDPKISLAEVIGLSKEIEGNLIAIIEIPIKK